MSRYKDISNNNSKKEEKNIKDNDKVGIGKNLQQSIEDEYQAIIDNNIDEKYIKIVCGITDFKKTTHLNIVIDTSLQSLLDLNIILPNLTSLTLDGSTISSIRDLGIGLRSLIKLSLNGCFLSDLDGVGVLSSLQTLSLCDNNISDITPLAMHDNIQTLNLCGNYLSDISIADALSSCPKLVSLFLLRNPIETAPNYRLIIASLISNLNLLDGSIVDSDASVKVSNSMVLEAASAMNLYNEKHKDERRMKEHNNNKSNGKNNNNGNSNTFQPINISDSSMLDTGSELTHGSSVALAGNMATAMRRRRSNFTSEANNESTLELLDGARSNNQQTLQKSNFNNDNSSKSIVNNPKVNNNVVKTSLDEREVSFFSEGDITEQVKLINLDINEEINDAFEDKLYLNSSNKKLMDLDRNNSILNRSSNPINAVKVATSDSWMSVSDNNKAAKHSINLPNISPKNSPRRSRRRHDSYESPRQLNSSRPQSATSSNCSSGSENQPSAIFKVAADYDDLKQLRTRINIASKRNTDESIDFDNDRGDNKSNVHPHSIVHRDIVRRNECIDDDDDEDNEEFAVTHAARHRLMSSQGVRPGTRGANNKRHPVVSSPIVLEKDNEDEEKLVYSPIEEQIRPNSRGIQSSSAPSNFKAGMSLGFDLKGSLAAIDQWVDGNDSDSDDGEIFIASKNNISSINNIKVENKKIEKKDKVLSRENIISMCIGIEQDDDSDNNSEDDNILTSTNDDSITPTSHNNDSNKTTNIELNPNTLLKHNKILEKKTIISIQKKKNILKDDSIIATNSLFTKDINKGIIIIYFEYFIYL
jgi:hypothetical protein